jgi:hypothetical protein
MSTARRVLQTIKALAERIIDAATGVEGEGHFTIEMRDILKRVDAVIAGLDKRLQS